MISYEIEWLFGLFGEVLRESSKARNVSFSLLKLELSGFGAVARGVCRCLVL